MYLSILTFVYERKSDERYRRINVLFIMCTENWHNKSKQNGIVWDNKSDFLFYTIIFIFVCSAAETAKEIRNRKYSVFCYCLSFFFSFSSILTVLLSLSSRDDEIVIELKHMCHIVHPYMYFSRCVNENQWRHTQGDNGDTLKWKREKPTKLYECEWKWKRKRERKRKEIAGERDRDRHRDKWIVAMHRSVVNSDAMKYWRTFFQMNSKPIVDPRRRN